MKDIFNNLSDQIKVANQLYTEVNELAAIWDLGVRFKANDKLTARITAGDLVTIKDGVMVNDLLDESGEPYKNTHVITTCWGTMVSDFSISVAELNTLELSQIKL